MTFNEKIFALIPDLPEGAQARLAAFVLQETQACFHNNRNVVVDGTHNMNKISAIKAIRWFTGISLAQAKEVSEQPVPFVVHNLKGLQPSAMVAELAAAGCTAHVQ